ncbi:SusC/RagA family TonB-linked outer membrane protein [Pedobacter heparinus]|uniref:SusC/RagA family TonB-linked outer membrane protein n=1 Tax=Pedobacter heparinus TaxID=984 RepID=UPI00292F715F|nr:SusC/RagA family TonB-linked outer membrane protein [Pedobacter heparinus]
MKLSIAILFVGMMQASAASFAQKITISKKNTTLQPVFNEIGKQSGYDFFYDANTLRAAKRINIEVKDASIEEALKICLEGQPLYYTIENKVVVIRRKEKDLADRISDFFAAITVKGKVQDESGQSLPGASVLIKGTKISTITNGNGEFELRNVNPDAILVFSYTGYMSQEIALNNRGSINVVLKEDNKALNEVVVTALGIKREEKALGYAITRVKGEDLMDAVSNNWTEALSGKVAGLNMIKSGGGPAGSNKIILRGESSLSGDNSALIVIDGVIVSSKITEGNGAYLGTESPVDFGNGISDLNPEDIDNITVLKGPGASALYGYRGANGAIIITTKSGKPMQKGMGISFNSNATLATINRWPDYQYEFGQGAAGQDTWYSYLASEDGASTRSTGAAWGVKFDGQEYYQYDPATNTKGMERTPWVPYKNNRKDFFETAATFTNSLSISGGNAKTNARLNFTNLKNTWIVPNTGYDRNTIALSVSQKVSDKLTIASKLNFNNKYSKNLPSTGYNNQTIMYSMISLVPNTDINWYRNYWVPGSEGITQVSPFSSNVDNPYLQAYEMLNGSKRNQLVGNVTATYEFSKALSLMVRSSMDWSGEARSQQRPKDTERFKDGMFRTQDIFFQEVNSDFLLSYKPKIRPDFDASFSFGGSAMKNNYKMVELRADRLRYPQIFTFANSKDLVIPVTRRTDYAVNSLYGLAQFGYKNKLFLDFTLRNDWSSLLATATSTENISFMYPSVNLSAILSDIFTLPSAVSYLKVRGSLAEVGGSGVIPYLTGYDYNPTEFPSGAANPVYIANPNLRPERSKTLELGADLKFFKSRLNIDFTYYRSNVTDQILRTPIDRASGWSSIILNSGLVRNKGVELQVNGTPVKKKSFSWNMFGTFAANRNTVVSLADSISTYIMQSGPRGTMEARVGKRMGDLYGLGYERAPDGQIVYNAQGYPVLSQETMYLGRATPDFTASFGNEFKYRQFRFKFLIDGQYGAVAYSHTHVALAIAGKLGKTLPGRYNGIIGDGVQQNADGTYRPNDVIATNISAYYNEHFKGDNVEANVFSTDFIKLREARMDYMLPAKMLKRLGLQSAMIGVYGRDLFMISGWPAFDPEFGTLGGSDIQRGFEIGQFPSTRSFGLNVAFSF